NALQSRLVAQISNSRMIHWSMYLGAVIFEMLLKDGNQASVDRFVPWIDRLNRICVVSDHDNTLDDLVNRLFSGLELVYLNYMMSNVNAGYSLVRRLAPTFMRLAFADPTLWPRDPTSNGISLAHTLNSPQLELGRYVFTEAVSGLMFGVPPLVEYDTSHPPIRTQEAHLLERVHGCALGFVMAIVKINVWRAQSIDAIVGSEPPWREIEAGVLDWRPRHDPQPDGDSRKRIAKLTVQEAWRQAVLIYLYMGMCRATSHDSRVQSSTQQIGQLIPAAEFSSSIGIHFVVPLLVAAICTRSEVQRARFRGAIIQCADNKPWVVDGTGLASVIDRLWHSAAADGAAVTWDDYVASRRATFHIDL
ncbi:hypothetical protein FRC07_013647, partial [Ceratobasidium sp. 392]